METSQIVLERTRVENQIKTLLNDFQKKTGMRVDYLGVDRPWKEPGQNPTGAQLVPDDVKAVSISASLA